MRIYYFPLNVLIKTEAQETNSHHAKKYTLPGTLQDAYDSVHTLRNSHAIYIRNRVKSQANPESALAGIHQNHGDAYATDGYQQFKVSQPDRPHGYTHIMLIYNIFLHLFKSRSWLQCQNFRIITTTKLCLNENQ